MAHKEQIKSEELNFEIGVIVDMADKFMYCISFQCFLVFLTVENH